jgi:hypothetical protein
MSPRLFLSIMLLFVLPCGVPCVIFASSDNWVEVTRFSDEIWFMPDYTSPFQIDCSEWRIRWEVESIFYLGDLNFWVVCVFGGLGLFLVEFDSSANGRVLIRKFLHSLLKSFVGSQFSFDKDPCSSHLITA